MSKEKKYKLLGALLIAVCCTLFLFPTLTNVFMLDDETLVGTNPSLASLDKTLSFFVNNIYGINDNAAPLYRPIMMLSLYLNRVLLGHHAIAYHTANLLLHTLASLLIYYLLAQFLGYSYKSLIPALIFSVHPIHTDTIAFILGRSDILALIFLLIGVLFLLSSSAWRSYFRFNNPSDESKSPKAITYTLIAAIFFSLALFSKETSVGILAIFFLFVFMKSLTYKRLPPFHPVLLGIIIFSSTLFLYLGMRYFALGNIGTNIDLTFFPERSFSKIFPTVARIFRDYIFSLLVPVSLNISYEDYIGSMNIFEISAVFSYIIHILIFTFAFKTLRKNPFLSFSIFAFYLVLLPVSHIIPFRDIKADRFLYIPSLFFCLTLSWPLNYTKEEQRHFRTAILLFGAIIVFYGSLTLNYSTLFESEEKLLAEMVNRRPQNIYLNFKLGTRFMKKGDYQNASIYLKRALSLHKHIEDAYSPLAISYSMLGNKDKAREVFLTGLKLFPDNVILYQNYAIFCYYNGDYLTAYEQIKQAFNLSPDDKQTAKIMKMIENALKGN